MGIRNRGIAVWLTVSLLVSLPLALAQVRTTGEIRGTVTDPSGAVVAGAELTLRDRATGAEKSTASGTSGDYVFLNLLQGVYDLRVTASGFQKAVLTGVVVETARAVDLPVQLTVGQVTETVEVKDVAPILETTSNMLATTVRNVANLPLTGRDVLPFALLFAGAQTIGNARDSTFNGLPNASLNISLDGMNNNSQRFKSGGTSFFAFATARVGAIEEVTITTAGTGSDAAGGGAMTMRFVTRRGTNKYHGSVFEQFRNDALNANAFFNNARAVPKAKLRLNEFGGNFGGRFPSPSSPRSRASCSSSSITKPSASLRSRCRAPPS